MPTPEIATTYLAARQRTTWYGPSAGTSSHEPCPPARVGPSTPWSATWRPPRSGRPLAACGGCVGRGHRDVRHALGRPGARDVDAVSLLARVLLQGWTPSRAVEVVTPRGTVRRGPDDGDVIRWTSTDFEVLRARLGRRSRRQLRAMDWSGDPGPLVEELAVFSPADVDIDE